MATLYDVKVIFSGNIIEVYRYGQVRASGYEKAEGDGNKKLVDFETGEIITQDQLHSREKSNIRARNRLRRLITTNFNNQSKFLTLTFRENVQDVEEANAVFKYFIYSMNRYLKRANKPSMAYVAVIEFQKRGAIHFHLVCNLKGVGANTIRHYWRNAAGNYEGNIDIKNIRHVDNVGAYLMKYMTKAGADHRLIGKKLYQTSQGLDKPKEVGLSSWKERDKRFLDDLLKDKKITYESDYLDKQTQADVKIVKRYSFFNEFRI